MTRTRQLAAIMFTDIEGYTALMQQNEAKAIQTREKHRQIFNSTTEKYEGRILQYYGDGTLSIFNSAIEAVKCATEMQLGFLGKPSIPVRIGIHIGDIIFSEDEIIGDGVNVASRIESLAVPGSVFISDKVYDEIKNQESLKTSLLKTFKLKNIERPTDVYAISNVGLIVPNPEDIRGKTEADPSSEPAKNEEPVPVPEPILATKLYIPPSRSKMVLRPRLIERMNKGQSGKLTLISAPPGFGKTTLVSEWISSCERATVWLSLDEGDNDPTRFLVYLVAAFQKVFPHTGQRVLALLQSPKPPPTESIVTYLLNEISAISENFTLVLDDCHLIDSEPVENALAFLLEHMPPQMHLVITTREDPKLPLPRLRVRGQLTELRISDLRFTPSEAAEFLNQVMGLNLTAENTAILEASTEGWVAGLQLAALSMQGRDDITGFVKAFAGDDRYVVDYLVEEVLQSQPEHIRSFLLQTSILDRLNGPLCDAITNQHESKGLLESMERGNLFVLPLDDRRQWYRYHHLFAEVLQARLMEEQSDLVPGLHLRASEWYEQNAHADEAVRHALAAKNFVRAADLIEIAWPLMNENCQATTWLDWAKKLPEELFKNRPVLLVGLAWASLQCGEMDVGKASLGEAESLLNTDEPSEDIIIVDEVQFRTLPASIANARAYYAQAHGDASGTLKYSQRALELLPDEEYIQRAIPAAMVGFIHWENGDLEAAYKSFSGIRASFISAGNKSSTISLTFLLADLRIAQGRLQEAANSYEHSLLIAIDEGETIPLGTEDVYRGISELHLERGNLEVAREYLDKSRKLGEQTKVMDWQYHLCLLEARVKKVEKDLVGALGFLDRAEKLYFRSPLPDLQPVAAIRTRVWIGQGKLDKAKNWAQEQGLSFDDDLS
ncbi:MAG: AAA family ATPase, partial [Bacteroidales bacterium]|nr:AAA family ATPase [Bacteroidales bacterium]